MTPEALFETAENSDAPPRKLRGARATRVPVMATRHHELFLTRSLPRGLRRVAANGTRVACAPRNYVCFVRQRYERGGRRGRMNVCRAMSDCSTAGS